MKQHGILQWVEYEQMALQPWMLSSEEVFDMMPFYRKLEDILIQISNKVRIEINDFINMVRYDP